MCSAAGQLWTSTSVNIARLVNSPVESTHNPGGRISDRLIHDGPDGTRACERTADKRSVGPLIVQTTRSTSTPVA